MLRSTLAVVLLLGISGTATEIPLDAEADTSAEGISVAVPEIPAPPQPTDLIETAGARLVQIDVTVTGPPDQVADLTAEDFSIKVNLFHRIRDFELDQLCEPPAGPDGARGGAAAATYIFYFDQQQLTLPGRQQALDLARELLPQLLHGTNRAMIVSNARELSVIEPLTPDPRALADALERLEHDPRQWDVWASDETARVGEILNLLNDQLDAHRAIRTARLYQREERWRADRNMRRLASVLTQLGGDVAPPKVLLYFADTLRANAGEHYLTFFGEGQRRADESLFRIGVDSSLGRLTFDRVIDEAAAQGIRVYSVLAQGLTIASDRVGATSRGGVESNSSRVRQNDVHDSMASLAAETGGASFLDGTTAPRVARRIAQDLSCLYILSFDPQELPEDEALRISVESRRRGVTMHARGRLIVQSPSRRLTARLLSAFSLADTAGEAPGVRGRLVPTGYRDGAYTALLQVRVPGTALPHSSWELGASILARERVREETSGRLEVSLPGVPAILEREVRVRPGLCDLISVAHEAKSGFVLSDRTRVDWPDPERKTTSIGPLVLLQPASGLFLRGSDLRRSGSVALTEADTLMTDQPAALVGLVCRDRKRRGSVTARRTLIGASVVEFAELALDLAEQQCVQVRDVLPPGAVGPGLYRYEIRVLEEGRQTDAGALEFVAADQPV